MAIPQNKKCTLYVHGMHCKACVVLTESELQDHPRVAAAVSNLEKRTVEVSGDFEGMSEAAIAEELSKVLLPHGYSLSTEPEEKKTNWKEFYTAIPVALGFIFLFFLLQKAGIVNLISASKVTYGTAFVVGIVASLSTCMAVVGGLLLSLSATYVKDGNKVKPQLLFHLGRLVSFFFLGGLIGLVGSAFQLNGTSTLVLGILVGLVMLILGLNLLDISHITKKLQVGMPSILSRKVFSLSKINTILTPLFVGAATFILPCGFTQSMQIYTLSTGSFLVGSLTMLSFALGTLPVLALVSFSSFSIRDSKKAGVFFKSAGLIVIIFALFNIINSLVGAGVIDPFYNF